MSDYAAPQPFKPSELDIIRDAHKIHYGELPHCEGCRLLENIRAIEVSDSAKLVREAQEHARQSIYEQAEIASRALDDRDSARRDLKKVRRRFEETFNDSLVY